MKIIKSVLLLLVAALFLCGSLNPASGDPSKKIVVFKQDISEDQMKAVVEGKGAQIVKRLHLINAMAIKLPEQAVEKVLQALKADASVLRIDDDLIIEALRGKPQPPTPTQPPQTVPWGISKIQAPQAWAYNSGSGVKVAIMDTGIDLSHPDLASNIAGGINEINPLLNADDDNGHGTHVAGIVAALNNDIGVVGVAPQASLYAVKVLNKKGSGFLSDIIDGISWCISNRILVINMSFGSKSGNQSFSDAIAGAYDAGIAMVAAAGNDGGPVLYPAKYPQVIAVSATDSSNTIASWSNKGSEVEVAAPGVNINSTYPGGQYKSLSGTSMACPHVAGTVALIIGSGKAVNFSATADDLGQPGKDDLYGYGLVNALKAVSN